MGCIKVIFYLALAPIKRNIFIAGGSLIPGFLANVLKLGAFQQKNVATTVRQAVTKMMCRFYVVPI